MSNPVMPWEPSIVEERPIKKLKRAKQVTEDHCGPATLEMLLGNLDITMSQIEISKAINAEEYIHERGTTPQELAEAVRAVTTDAQLWCKEETTLEDLDALVNQFHYPVGVEWQNLFYSTIEEELADTNGHPENYDFGHYSIITHFDLESLEVTMVDPYFEFEETYRYFSIPWFESRWWDVNDIKDPITHHYKRKKDIRVSFIITLKGTSFPKMLGFKPL